MADIGQNDAVINVGVEIDSRRLYSQIANIAAKVPPIRLKFQGQQALGTISKDANDFQRSLQAASARVLAFGATAGQIYAVASAIRQLTKSTVEVEKALTDINVVLGLSATRLAKFSDELFSIASLTGQSFKTASIAALEFSRQGLTVEQTLKRTADALTLARLSGLDAAKSVDTITAALNGFNDATLTSTSLINKLATVDAAFAVSTADLAEAFTRVGSTASDTGVKLDSLIAIVTSAQQTTARGGSVIGNALKTIFQRIQRPEVIDTFKEFNIQVEDSQGQMLSADKILQNLAKTYQTASQQQQNFIVGLSAGVFQSNQFRAILSDLAKENSVYSRALQTSTSATDAAAQRQTQLNKTLSASLNDLVNNVTRVGAKIGDLSIRPVIEKSAELVKTLGAGFEDAIDGEGIGGVIGKGILSGLGNYISGPGLVAAGVLAGKLFVNFSTQAIKSVGTILESVSSQYKQTVAINSLMEQQPGIYDRITKGALSEAQAQEVVLNLLRLQNIELSRKGQVVETIRTMVKGGNLTVSGDRINIPRSAATIGTPKKALGHIPEIEERMGAYAGGYTPGNVKEMNIPQLGRVYYNDAETIRRFPGMSQPAIMPPQFQYGRKVPAAQEYKAKFEKAHGFDPYASKGLVPNFAQGFDSSLLHGKKIGIDKSFQTSASHAISKAMQKNRLSEDDMNEIAAFFRNPVIDKSRIVSSIPSSVGVPGEQEINYILPSSGKTGIQMVLAVNPERMDKSRIVSIKNRTGFAANGIIPNARKKGQIYDDEDLFPDFSSGLVPNYAGLLTSLNVARKGLSALGGKIGVSDLTGVALGKTSPDEILPKIMDFLKSPSDFIKSREDLEAVKGIVNTVRKIPAVSEKLAVLGSRKISSSSFDNVSMADKIEGGDVEAGLDKYARYRLFGGKLGPQEFANSGLAGAADFDRQVVAGLKQNRDGSLALPREVMASTFSNPDKKELRGINEYDDIIRSAERIVENRNLRSGYQERKLEGNKFLGYTHLLGRFGGKINKSKTKAIYDDTWDVGLHPNEQQLLDSYFAGNNRGAIRDSLNSLNRDADYGGGIDSLMLRDIVGNLAGASPIRFRGVVKLPKREEDNLRFNKGLIPNYADLFDTNILKQITQEQGIFGKKLDIRTRNTSQIRAAMKVSEKTGISVEQLLGDSYFQSEFRKFVPSSAAKGLVPNYTLSFGALKNTVKFAKNNGVDFRRGLGDSPYASYPTGAQGRDSYINVPKGTSGEVIAHEVGHIFGSPNNTASQILGEQYANTEALNLLRKYRDSDSVQFRKLARENIKNYKIDYLTNKIDRAIGVKAGEPLKQLLNSRIDFADVPVATDLQTLKINNKVASHNLRALIEFAGRDKVKGLIKNLKRDSSFFDITLGARAFSNGLVPNYSALNDAISRENQAGIPFSQIRVGQSSRIQSLVNPLGLGVYNTRDEPLGLNQGIQRVASMGLDPKRAGVPNYVDFERSGGGYIGNSGGRTFIKNASSPEQEAQIQRSMKQELGLLINAIKKGTITQVEANKKMSEIAIDYSTTAEGTSKLNAVVQQTLNNQTKLREKTAQALNQANRRPSVIGTKQTFGGKSNEQLEIEDRLKFEAARKSTPSRLLTQDEIIARRFPRKEILDQKFLSNNLLNSDVRNIQNLKTAPDLRSLGSIPLYQSLTKQVGSIQDVIDRKTIENAKAIEKQLNDIKSKSGFFSSSGRSNFAELQKQSPDLAREFKQSFQNKAFLASIAAPIAGGVIQQGILSNFGNTTTGRGSAKVVEEVTGSAGLAATAIGLGASGPVGIGIGVITLLAKVPDIFKSFSDTLPDLQKRFGELQDASQKTSAAFASYIDSSEKLSDVFSGKVQGLTNGQIKQLEQGQLDSLLSIPNIKDRNRIGGLVKSGNIAQAREEIGGINQRNNQVLNANAIAQTVKTLIPSIKSRPELEARSLILATQLSSAGDFGLPPDIAEVQRNKEQISKRFFNDPVRSKQIENVSSPVNQAALGLTNNKNESIFDILLNRPDLSTKISNAKPNQVGKAFSEVALSLEGFDPEAIAKIAEAMNDLATKLGTEFTSIVEDNFSISGLQKNKELSREFKSNTQQTILEFYAINKALLASKNNFDNFGESVKLSGITRLSELTSDLKTLEIESSTRDQSKLLRRGGEGLSNLLGFNRSELAVSTRAVTAKQELQNQTGGGIIDLISESRENLLNNIQKRFTPEKDPTGEFARKQIELVTKQFDGAFEPFIDELNNGRPITAQFLKSLELATEEQLAQAEAIKNNFSLPPNERANPEIKIDTLVDLSKNLKQVQRSFNRGQLSINADENIGRAENTSRFRQGLTLVNDKQRIGLENIDRVGNFDAAQIARQSQLNRNSRGLGLINRININAQSQFESGVAGIQRDALTNPKFNGLLNNTNIRNPEDLNKIISQQQKIVSSYEKIPNLTKEQTEELTIQNDALNALKVVQAEIINLDKIRIENIEQQTEETNRLLKLNRTRIDQQREINKDLALDGNGKGVVKDFGKTFSIAQSFNSNDFFNQLSEDNADFAEEFKSTFKAGFAEAATGASTFEDALEGIATTLGKSILTKSTNLATDQLFASLFGSQSNLTGGAGILAGLFKKNGGAIKKYAYGGSVTGGSGLRDDVPALLGGGEFVIKKSSAQNLGLQNLEILNQNPGMARDFISAPSNREARATLANEYFGVGSKTRPTSGISNVSSLLSAIALEDENNPQNKLRAQRQQYFVDLLEYNNENAKTLKKFEKQQTARRTSAYISAGINLAGSLAGSAGKTNNVSLKTAGISSGYANTLNTNLSNPSYYGSSLSFSGRNIGGVRYANGGNVFGGDTINDNVPAMLMGGEFVFNKQASKSIGAHNLNYMNKTGRLPGYAAGGQVGGRDYSTSYSESSNDIAKYIADFVSISAQIRDSLTAKSQPAGQSTSGIVINNNISVTVSEAGVATNSTTTTANKKDESNSKDNQTQGKQFGEAINKLITQSLVKESKNGGILDNIFKKR